MRIGLIIYGPLDFPSGGFVYDKRLLETLRKKKHHVEIISLPWESYPRLILQNYDKEIFEKIEAANLDLLLQDELNHPSLFLLNKRIKRELKLPIISIVHHLRISEFHPPLLKKLYRAIEKRYINSVDGFIVNSKATQTSLFPLLEKNIPMLLAQPGGNRLKAKATKSVIKKRSFQKGALKILFLGAIIRRKSPHFIIEALSRLENTDFDVQFAGDKNVAPKYFQSIVSLTEKLKLGKSVQFLGQVNSAELMKLMKVSHLLVVPSSYEGYGIAYAEGMAQGLPAIGRNAGGASEIIKHGENGYLLSTGDLQELANLLLMLANDRNKLYQMSLAARESFDDLPKWEDSMTKIEAFLVDQLARAGGKLG